MDFRIEWRNDKKYRWCGKRWKLCCIEKECTNYAASGPDNLKCAKHGGGKKCKVENCEINSRSNGLCSKHSKVTFGRQQEGNLICSKCKEIKDISEYHSNKYATNGLRSDCKNCAKKRRIDQLNTLEGYVCIHFCALKTNARHRKIPVEITANDIILKYKEQKGICAITGDILAITNLSNPMRLSVDRIDSSKGYTYDNIQLVGQVINIMKWDLIMKDFVFFCKKVADNYQSTE